MKLLKRHVYACVLFFLSLPAFSEGSYEIQNFDNESATRLLIGAQGNENEFAALDAKPENRLYIHISDKNETLLLGFHCQLDNIYFRLMAPNGEKVDGYDEVKVPKDGSGFIDNFEVLAEGPIDGYEPLVIKEFEQVGDYYIEFFGENSPFVLDVFDANVVSTNDEIETGRLWSKYWSFTNQEVKETQFDLYIYTTDRYVTKLTYNNMKLESFRAFANSSGTKSTSDIEKDRLSISGKNEIPEFPIYLNSPDHQPIEVNASGSVAEIQVLGCYEDRYVSFQADQPGKAYIYIDVDLDGDFAQNSKDVLIIADVEAGQNDVPWDGKNGAGDLLPSGEKILVKIEFVQGLTHFPIYGVHSMGGLVLSRDILVALQPLAQFWNDTEVDGDQNTDNGCISILGTGNCHTYSKSTNVTINTWWYHHKIETNWSTITLIDANMVVNMNQTLCLDNNFDITKQSLYTGSENVSGNGPMIPQLYKFSSLFGYTPYTNSNLTSGDYAIIAQKNSDSYCIDTFDFEVLEAPFVTVPTGGSNFTINAGQTKDITYNFAGNDFPYEVSFTDGSTTFNETVTSSSFTVAVAPTTTSTYIVDKITTQNGCEFSNTQSIGGIVVNVVIPESQVKFFDMYAVYGDDPVKPLAVSNNTAVPFTYEILGTNNCVSLTNDNYFQLDCAGEVTIVAHKAASTNFQAGSDTATLFIDKAESIVNLKPRGAKVDADTVELEFNELFYDGVLQYQLSGIDTSIVTLLPDGRVIPHAVGVVTIVAIATENNNFKGSFDNIQFNVFEEEFGPIAVDDTLEIDVGVISTLNIIENDTGVTGEVIPAFTDLDLESKGIQTTLYDAEVGTFTIDSVGILTLIPFEAFVSEYQLRYIVYDDNQQASNEAIVYISAETPLSETSFKPNEIITPNGDDVNDVLLIGYTDASLRNELRIYDNMGNKVYSEDDYTNDWEGVDDKGNLLPTGVYFYTFTEYSNNQKQRSITSYIQIVR